MPSLAARRYRAHMSRRGSRQFGTVAAAEAMLREGRDFPVSPAPPRSLERDFLVSVRHVETGRSRWPVYVVRSTTAAGAALSNVDTAPRRAVVFLHGGAYVGQMYPEAWHFVGRLAKTTGHEIVVPIYPLVPHVDAERLVDESVAIWRSLADDYDELMLVGASAGAGLGLATLLADSGESALLVRAMVMVTPWTDLTMTAPDIDARAMRDPILSPVVLRVFAERFAGERDLTDWRVSPGRWVRPGLPPAQIFVAEDDILFSDGEHLATNLVTHHNPVELVLGEQMLHQWPITALPEAELAIDQMRRFIAQNWSQNS